jgi:glycerophosphoryl diester phosphodiesterase
MKKVLLAMFVIGLSQGVCAQVEFSSHRGSSLHAPENTKASVKLAWEQGADAVEIDVHLSKDNRLMVIHDSNTKRTSGEDYRVEDTVSDILRMLDVGSFKGEQYKNERIPFLEEIIEMVPPAKTLYIELKCGLEGLPYLQKAINESTTKGNLAIICFDYDVIVTAKEMFPDHSCHYLIGDEEGLKENIKKAALKGIDAIDMRHSLINQEIVDYVHSLSMSINAWTVDDPRDAKRLLGLGLDGIETNCVSCLKELLN